MNLPPFFQYRDGALFCEDVALSDVTERFGTPCYAYSESALRTAFRDFRDTFAAVDPHIRYAVKANSNLSLLRIIHEEGGGFDIVSEGEWFRLRRLSVDPAQVVFSGVGKSESELRLALRHSILLQVESLAELEQLIVMGRESGQVIRLSLRLNPDVAAPTHPHIATGQGRHKFGIEIDALQQALGILRESRHLQLVGVGCHIGSQILELEPFRRAFLTILGIAREFRAGGFPIRQLDLGGGFGIPRHGETWPDWSAYASLLAERRGDYQVVLEPGRIIVARSGALLSRVLYRKTNCGRRFLVVDAAMNDLIRPALYDAFHPIRPLRLGARERSYDVVGPICESGDFLGRERVLPEMDPGDGLAILDAGAYGFVLASNYNSRRLPCEVLISGDETRLIRRRQSFEELLVGESEPPARDDS